MRDEVHLGVNLTGISLWRGYGSPADKDWRTPRSRSRNFYLDPPNSDAVSLSPTPTTQPTEPRRGEDTDIDIEMDLGEGTSNPAPDESPGSDPKLPESKPKHKHAFVKIMELDEKKMLISYLEAYFGKSYRSPFSFDPSVDRLLRQSDRFHYFKATRGELHRNISVDTIIHLEEPKKGGLLHLDPPMRTSGITRLDFLSLPSQMVGANLRFCSSHPR